MCLCVCVAGGGGSIKLHTLPLYISQYTISNLATQVLSCFYIDVWFEGGGLNEKSEYKTSDHDNKHANCLA